MKHYLITLSVLLSSASAFAHGNAFSMTADAISAAAEKFEKEEPNSLSLYTGVKGWPNADKIQVKVYLSNNTTINYVCSMMTMNNQEMMMCDKQ